MTTTRQTSLRRLTFQMALASSMGIAAAVIGVGWMSSARTVEDDRARAKQDAVNVTSAAIKAGVERDALRDVIAAIVVSPDIDAVCVELDGETLWAPDGRPRDEVCAGQLSGQAPEAQPRLRVTLAPARNDSILWLIEAFAALLLSILAATIVSRVVAGTLTTLLQDIQSRSREGGAALAEGSGDLGQIAAAFNRISRDSDEQVDALRVAVANLEEELGTLRASISAREATDARPISAAQDLRSAVLAEAAEDSIVAVTAAGVVAMYNPKARRTFGWAPDAIIGASAHLILPELFAPEHEQHDNGPLFDNTRIETLGKHADGRRFPAEITTGVLDDGAMLLIVRDVTERKVAEQNLQNIQSNLELKVVERISQLSRINNQLQSEVNDRKRAEETALEASRAKSLFLANMSHELRTPLNAIIGYAELVIDECDDAGHDEYREDLERIRTAARHLLGIIHDILRLSKLEAGEMTARWEDFAVGDLIQQLRTQMVPKAERNRNELITVVSSGLTTMRSDPEKLGHVLDNLVSNACKFTEDGNITLRVFFEDDGRKVIFEVEDTGIGISEQDQQKLFRTFSQADPTPTRRYGGTGLGLALARRFARMLGGDIEVSSEIGRGSVFTVRLPIDGEAHRRWQDEAKA